MPTYKLEACKRGFDAKPGERCPYKQGSDEAKWWTYWRGKRQQQQKRKEEAA